LKVVLIQRRRLGGGTRPVVAGALAVADRTNVVVVVVLDVHAWECAYGMGMSRRHCRSLLVWKY
jgi:hypothetical protein